MSLAYPDGRRALPAAPHRTRTAARAVGSALGQAHWPPPQAGATSGRWPTVPGVTHLIACAQVGPIRTPGGPPNPRGRVPHQRLSRALVTPAPPRSLRCLFLPSRFRPQGHPPVPRPLPCPLAPAMPRLPLLSAPALACWCPLLPVLFFFLPPPCHLAVSSLSSPFSWVGGGVGGGGGGVLAVRPIAQARRKHGAGTRRGTCPSAGGGGARRVAPCVTLPFLRLHPWWSPRLGLHGACSLLARSCGSSRTLAPLPPTLPRRPRGGGPLPSTVVPHVPSTSPRCPRSFPWWAWVLGVGWGGAPSLPFLRRKHVAGTALARGTALVLLLGSGARRVAPVFALPTLRSLPRCPPRRGLHACFPWARSCGPSRALSPPSPLPAALSSGGGAAVRPSLPASPTLGGAEARGGGGGLVSFPSSLSCHRHEVRHPTPALPVVPPPGLARCVPSSGTVVWFVPPLLPPRPAALPWGGGSLVASPLSALPALWGAGLGGGGRCALFVSPPLHARRRQDVGTTQSRGEALGCCGGGGGFAVWAFLPCSMV